MNYSLLVAEVLNNILSNLYIQIDNSGKITEREMALLLQNAIKVTNNDDPTTIAVIQQILSESELIKPDEEYSDIELIEIYAKALTQKEEVVV